MAAADECARGPWLDCVWAETSSIDNNFGSAHAWDEGVAFYTGSQECTNRVLTRASA